MEFPKWLTDDVEQSERSWNNAHTELPKLIQKITPFATHGVEVGVAYGSMVIAICERISNLKITAIDPYIPYDVEDSMSRTIEEQNAIFNFTNKRLKNRFPERVRLIRDYGMNAVKNFQDNELDFVFIDACHQYEAVYEDIRAWWPKIKTGGFLSGHDFNTGWVGVTKAVTEFCLNEIKKPFFEAQQGNIWVCQK